MRKPDPKIIELCSQIEALSFQLAELKGDLQASRKVRTLQTQLNDLREQVEIRKIEKGRMDEDFARERREIQHHVGLERKRSEAEVLQASQQAILDVREENLQAEKDRFTEHMDFYKQQMDKHIDDVKSLLNQVMTRIPTVNVDMNRTLEITEGTVREEKTRKQ